MSPPRNPFFAARTRVHASFSFRFERRRLSASLDLVSSLNEFAPTVDLTRAIISLPILSDLSDSHRENVTDEYMFTWDIMDSKKSENGQMGESFM
jgi:hypothetical protein